MTEMEDLFEVLQADDVIPYCSLLVKRLAKCLYSENVQVVEKTLYKLNNKYFTNVMMKDKRNFHVLARGIYKALRYCCDENVNVSIRQMAQHVIGLFIDCDMDFMGELSKELAL